MICVLIKKIDTSLNSSRFTYYCILCLKYPETVNITVNYSIINKDSKFHLSGIEIDIIQSRNKELNDLIINRFGEVLNAHLDDAYHYHQDVLFCSPGLTKYVVPVPVSKKKIQILYGGKTNSRTAIGHWVCTYYDGHTIHTYNSLKHIPLLDNQLTYLNALYPHHPDIKHVAVQQQNAAHKAVVYLQSPLLLRSIFKTTYP